mgnify:CR=1 FL=1
MKQLVTILILIIAGYLSLTAQSGLPKQWTFSLSSGGAIPVGIYGKNDAANAAIYMPDIQNPWIIGLDKEKSGFAKTGYYYNAEIKFRFNHGIAVFLRSGQFKNSVQTDGISQFLTEKFALQKLEHVDYEVFYITPGLEYSRQFNNFNVGLSAFAGSSNCNYPYYKSILLYITTDPPPTWGHEGKRPNLKALCIGSLLNLDYRITSRFLMGLEVMYQKADFKYEMTTRTIPGFSPNPTIQNTLKLSVVNIGLKIGYKL